MISLNGGIPLGGVHFLHFLEFGTVLEKYIKKQKKNKKKLTAVEYKFRENCMTFFLRESTG